MKNRSNYEENIFMERFFLKGLARKRKADLQYFSVEIPRL